MKKVKTIKFLALDRGKDIEAEGIPTGRNPEGFIELRYTLRGVQWQGLIPAHRILSNCQLSIF
jgi:hypothetical protein